MFALDDGVEAFELRLLAPEGEAAHGGFQNGSVICECSLLGEDSLLRREEGEMAAAATEKLSVTKKRGGRSK